MVFHQQVADLPSVLRLTQILTSCGTNIEMSANLKAIWSVKMAPLNSHVESPARTLSMSSCTRSPQLENGFCMLRSLRGAWTGKNTMSNMVCICLVSFPTPTGKLSKRFVTTGGSFEEKILGIWESIQAFYLLPTHYGPAAQKTQSWQASWYFFKVVKLQQGVALYDYQHGSKLGDFFLWWWFAPKFHVLFVRVLQLGFLISTYLLCPLLWSGPPEDLPMYDDASGDTWVAEEIPNESCLIFWVCWPSHPQVGNVPVLFPDILCKVFLNVASHKGELQVQSQWLPDACETLGEQPWLGATAFGTLAFWVQQVAQGAIGGTPTQPSHRKNQERVFWLTVLVFGDAQHVAQWTHDPLPCCPVSVLCLQTLFCQPANQHLRFLKTADLVEKEPWDQKRAAIALRDLVAACHYYGHMGFHRTWNWLNWSDWLGDLYHCLNF